MARSGGGGGRATGHVRLRRRRDLHSWRTARDRLRQFRLPLVLWRVLLRWTDRYHIVDYALLLLLLLIKRRMVVGSIYLILIDDRFLAAARIIYTENKECGVSLFRIKKKKIRLLSLAHTATVHRELCLASLPFACTAMLERRAHGDT